MMDLDDFKKINDTYGHQVGDAVLRSTAGVIIGALRGCDTVARFGGEEFLVLLPETDLIRCEATMGRLRQLIEANEVVVDESGPVRVTVSIGIAAFDPDYPVGLPSLIGSADEALYRAKNQGKNRLVVSRDAAHATASAHPSQA
jgi:diguanylate cyclase (GGDEF)-like protein